MFAEINNWDIEENKELCELIQKVVSTCFKEEKIPNAYYLSVILTNKEKIKEANKKYRNIDKDTDVLSFPMFEKDEIEEIIKNNIDEENSIQEVLRRCNNMYS